VILMLTNGIISFPFKGIRFRENIYSFIKQLKTYPVVRLSGGRLCAV
jgi:hypothetical protein